jgi:cysteinyl-tRNA synthetase
VNIDGEKMSKSLGNFWTIRDILEKVPALTLRMALINAHYRSPIDMNEQIINDAIKNTGRIHDTYKLLLKNLSHDPIQLPRGDLSSMLPLPKSIGLLEKIAEDFARAMDDDFNSREAVSKLIAGSKELTKVVNQISGDDQKAYATMGVLWMEELAGDVLGLLPTREKALLKPETDPRREAISQEVDELLRQRTIARDGKNWVEADAIRDKLSQIGVTVTDTADGPVWELA